MMQARVVATTPTIPLCDRRGCGAADDNDERDYDGDSERETSSHSGSTTSSSGSTSSSSSSQSSNSASRSAAQHFVVAEAAERQLQQHPPCYYYSRRRSGGGGGGGASVRDNSKRGERELLLVNDKIERMRSELVSLRAANDRRSSKIEALEAERSGLARMLYADQSSEMHFRAQYDRERWETEWMRNVVVRLGDETAEQRARVEREGELVRALGEEIDRWLNGDLPLRPRPQSSRRDDREPKAQARRRSSVKSALGLRDAFRRSSSGTSSSRSSSSSSGGGGGTNEKTSTGHAKRGSSSRKQLAPREHDDAEVLPTLEGRDEASSSSNETRTRRRSSSLWDKLRRCSRQQKRSKEEANSIAIDPTVSDSDGGDGGEEESSAVSSPRPAPVRIVPFRPTTTPAKHSYLASTVMNECDHHERRRREAPDCGERTTDGGASGGGSVRVLSSRNLRLALAAAAS